MGRPSKGLTTSLAFRTKIPNKKKGKISITDITNQDFRKLLNNFNNSPYIGYKSKKFHNEPNEAYFFLIKNITKTIKRDRHVRLRIKGFKLGVNKTIGHANEKIQSKELEIINETNTCSKESDKDKETFVEYDIKGEEKTSRTSEKKEKSCDGYVRIHECEEKILDPTYECACTAQEINIIHTKYIVDIFSYEIKEISSTNQ